MTDLDPIVMIEDDEGHASLIERNIRRAGVDNPIRHFRDGTSAVDFFFGQHAQDSLRRCPSLVFLDLNLPDMNGTDILKRLKQDQRLRRLMVIVLTTTDDRTEIDRCYDFGCNVYLTKPLHYRSFADILSRTGQFLSVIQKPGSAPC